MTAATVKLAVLSFAHTHAAAYIDELTHRDDIELMTCDPGGSAAQDPGPRGAEFAARAGVPYVENYDEVFAWGPDAVIVTSENSRHRELVERSADVGAHILCEKPLATSLDDGQAMLDAVARAGVQLMMAYPVRFSSAFIDVRDRVRRGELGEVLGLCGTNNGKMPTGERAWFTDPELAGGGALVDHVVHCAQLIDELLGETAESVRAVSNRILRAEHRVAVETGGLVTLRFPSGVVATIDCSWSYPEEAPTWGGLTLQVVGSDGIATAAPFAQHATGYGHAGTLHIPVGDSLDAAMLGAFIESVRTGRAAVADGAVGYRTLQIVDAARRSATTGEPVALA